jgi:hypothetical protein
MEQPIAIAHVEERAWIVDRIKWKSHGGVTCWAAIVVDFEKKRNENVALDK